jgi:adenine-specific DNA glycosylase
VTDARPHAGTPRARLQPRADDEPDHALVDALLAWYADSARDLPWRAPDRTPWGVLVSEVMLQQTPVALPG